MRTGIVRRKCWEKGFHAWAIVMALILKEIIFPFLNELDFSKFNRLWNPFQQINFRDWFQNEWIVYTSYPQINGNIQLFSISSKWILIQSFWLNTCVSIDWWLVIICCSRVSELWFLSISQYRLDFTKLELIFSALILRLLPFSCYYAQGSPHLFFFQDILFNKRF